ncbi:MAG: hypothetical protein V4665_04455 [Patescibacteria group bacterium]
MQTCNTCAQEFKIRDEDTVFYRQIGVPSPLYCPPCRMMQRLAFRNERTLYKRPCDLCHKEVISIYVPGTPFPVYCHSCWWSDEWDPKSYAQDYDPSRPFIDQVAELRRRVPRVALLVVNSVRSDYTNSAGDNKDCYLIFASDGNEDSSYSRLIMKCKSVFDCSFAYDSELCYECIDCRASFKCLYSEQCQSSSDLLFCFNMRDSQNCIFCTNGRHMSYGIFNEKCTKEEYEAKRAEILSTYESIEAAKEQYEKLRSNTIVKYATQTKCHNVTGDYMFNCYDGVRLFDVSNAKNSSYMADSEDPIDCQDCNNVYYKPEFCYQLVGVLQSSKSLCSTFIFYCNEIAYCDSCYNLSSSLGCAAIRKGEYMILNKQYAKDEYEIQRSQIIESMRADGSYGQFFPPSLSPFGYNETLAKEYFPLSEEGALEKGFRWQEHNTGTFGKETLTEDMIPKTIEEVEDSITSDILSCNECGKNFRITQAELDFYRRMHIPLPHTDFECRHRARMSKRNPRALWHRSCMCREQHHINHDGHACAAEFETSYSPERQETLYCESCYQQEVA